MHTPAQRFWMTIVSWGGVSVIVLMIPALSKLGGTAAAWVQAIGSIAAIGAGFAVIETTRRSRERSVRAAAVAVAENAYQAILQTAQSLRTAESRRLSHAFSFVKPQLTMSLVVMDDAIRDFPAHETGHAEFGQTFITLRVLLARSMAEVVQSNTERAAKRTTEPQTQALERLTVDAEATLRELASWR